jgi:hypothetical protein
MSRIRCPHSSTYPGKRVRCVLRDGSILEGKFLGGNDRFVELEGHGRILKKNLRCLPIIKGVSHHLKRAAK